MTLRHLIKNKNVLWILAFTGPFMLGLGIFTYAPMIWSAGLSFFQSYNSITPQKFVGLNNYRDLLHDSSFRQSLLTFIIFAVVIIPLTYLLALSLATLLERLQWGKIIFRTIIVLPAAVSYVAASIIWKLSIFNGVRFGVVNTILKVTTGHRPIPWLSSPEPPWYWIVIISLRLWLQVGFYVVLLLAGLRRIDPHLYEASRVDGISQYSWQSFWRITFPQLRPISAAVILLIAVGAFQAFDEFYNLLATTSGYPPYARPPLIYLYYLALGESQDFGHGGAGAIILILIILGITLAQRYASSGRNITVNPRKLFTFHSQHPSHRKISG